jgi:DNA-binding MarR family transcriptional regulator
LLAQYQRTRGGIVIGHREWVQTLGGDKSNISHSLRTLETRGVIEIGRTPGGKADYVDLTSEGRKLICKTK